MSQLILGQVSLVKFSTASTLQLQLHDFGSLSGRGSGEGINMQAAEASEMS